MTLDGVIMPFVTIRHVTTYRYRRPVAFGEHRMMLRPRDSHDQRVIQAELRISPEPTNLRFVQDVFGNNVGIARFSRRSKELSFKSVVSVEHSPCNGFVLEDAGRSLPADYSGGELRDLAAYFERHQLEPIDEVGRWAQQLLLPSGAIGAFELLTRLSQAIHDGFLYKRREAKGIQPPTETLRLGHGSCRDFAMLMIDAARSFGLAARFSSGYLALPVSDRQEQTSGSARGSNSCLGANLPAGSRLGRFRSYKRQRRQRWPCHGCGCTRSSACDPASRHLCRISVGPSGHGGGSVRHVWYPQGRTGRSPAVRSR